MQQRTIFLPNLNLDFTKNAYYQDLQIHWQNCQMNPPSNYHRDVFSLNVAGKKTVCTGPKACHSGQEIFTPYPMTDSGSIVIYHGKK